MACLSHFHNNKKITVLYFKTSLTLICYPLTSVHNYNLWQFTGRQAAHISPPLRVRKRFIYIITPSSLVTINLMIIHESEPCLINTVSCGLSDKT